MQITRNKISSLVSGQSFDSSAARQLEVQKNRKDFGKKNLDITIFLVNLHSHSFRFQARKFSGVDAFLTIKINKRKTLFVNLDRILKEPSAF